MYAEGNAKFWKSSTMGKGFMKYTWKKCCIVLCREDSKPDGTPGDYVLAARRFFTRDEAEEYTKSISPSCDLLICKIQKNNAEWIALLHADKGNA